MVECDYCGEDTELAFKCKYCGGTFCPKHRLPENHECPGLEEENKKLREEGKIMAPTPSEKKRNKRKSPRSNLFDKLGNLNSNLTNTLFRHGVAYTIIGICLFSFLLQQIIPAFTEFMIIHPGYRGVLAPIRVIKTSSPLGIQDIISNVLLTRPWSLITSIFIHSNVGHLFINMLILFFFGPELEKRIGKKRFIKIFLIAGIAGSLGHLLFSYISGILRIPIYVPALGASGSILGIFTALAFVAPNIRVLVFFLIPAKIKHVLIFYILYNIYGMITQVMGGTFGGIGYAAHLAGIIVGIYYGRKFKNYGKYNPWNWI